MFFLNLLIYLSLEDKNSELGGIGLISPIFHDSRLLVTHLGRPVFLSGMNLAWIHFGNDLDDFDETTFKQALKEIRTAGGNCIRWWLHTTGTKSPIFGADQFVAGISPQTIPNLKKALDLALEEKIGLILTLWSFDMLQDQGQDLAATKRLVEDPAATGQYIRNALTPMVKAVKGHPAIVAWEVCNEPEGMTATYGWSYVRTGMRYVQQFTNLIAGAIHRKDPQALVTNGSWSLWVVANGHGLANLYSDTQLIKAGGDELGYLDFYQIHYYPEWGDESLSPFHHPAAYWNLDKPLLIGEFPAKGVIDLGRGFRPKTTLTPEEAYRYALENGYAGVLSWTWTGHDGNGGANDAAPGMKIVSELAPDKVKF